MSTAQPTVKTVQFTDPRIEPQPDPVYDYVIAPTQNQYYRINASSRGTSSIAFNNLTTLGVDRAYLDTFEIELTANFEFHIAGQAGGVTAATAVMCPMPDEWTFDSFPFNKICDTIHVNINGGAFFSQPLSYLKAKERYMDQKALSRCYENVCPVHRPMCQYESGDDYTRAVPPFERETQYDPSYVEAVAPANNQQFVVADAGGQNEARMGAGYKAIGRVGESRAKPTRYGVGMHNFMQSAEGMDGGFNNSIVRLGKPLTVNGQNIGYTNYHFKYSGTNIDYNYVVVTVTWREPIFCSPFSSRYDATYGRPLYNITSMDLTFTLNAPENMIRLMHRGHVEGVYVQDYNVTFTDANLCYQVMTIPPIMKKPLTTLVPYRRFVPYITDFPPNTIPEGNNTASGGTQNVNISSGVYTFNEIPTAIWLFVAPSKKFYQSNYDDLFTTGGGDSDGVNTLLHGNWDCNKLFANIDHVSLTLANTTQILNTAEPVDLYRIAKANGCQDSYLAWRGDDVLAPRLRFPNSNLSTGIETMYQGPGSVLRLIPGVDLIVPDQALIPGANANNMVFKADVQCTIPPHGSHHNIGSADVINTTYSLWLIFEYVGVAAISPGQCEITMNPLGSGEIMAASPIVSGTSDSSEGTLEGSGWLDSLVRGFRKGQQVAKDTGVVSRILKLIPEDTAQKAGQWAEKLGYGERGCKRARGGAVMGKGLADWSV